MNKNESRLIAEFDKNSAEVVKVNLQTWKAQTYFDVRVWYRDGAGHEGAENPTHKGITLNVELLPDLRRALDEVERALEKGEESAPEVGEKG